MRSILFRPIRTPRARILWGGAWNYVSELWSSAPRWAATVEAAAGFANANDVDPDCTVVPYIRGARTQLESAPELREGVGDVLHAATPHVDPWLTRRDATYFAVVDVSSAVRRSCGLWPFG